MCEHACIGCGTSWACAGVSVFGRAFLYACVHACARVRGMSGVGMCVSACACWRVQYLKSHSYVSACARRVLCTRVCRVCVCVCVHDCVCLRACVRTSACVPIVRAYVRLVCFMFVWCVRARACVHARACMCGCVSVWVCGDVVVRAWVRAVRCMRACMRVCAWRGCVCECVR